MKKLFFIAALGVAGMMSASNGSIQDSNSSDDIALESSASDSSTGCYTITYITSCGFPIQDSWCTGWGPECSIMNTWEMFDDYFCAP